MNASRQLTTIYGAAAAAGSHTFRPMIVADDLVFRFRGTDLGAAEKPAHDPARPVAIAEHFRHRDGDQRRISSFTSPIRAGGRISWCDGAELVR